MKTIQEYLNNGKDKFIAVNHDIKSTKNNSASFLIEKLEDLDYTMTFFEDTKIKDITYEKGKRYLTRIEERSWVVELVE